MVKHYKESLIPHLLNVAKRLILKKNGNRWKAYRCGSGLTHRMEVLKYSIGKNVWLCIVYNMYDDVTLFLYFFYTQTTIKNIEI